MKPIQLPLGVRLRDDATINEIDRVELVPEDKTLIVQPIAKGAAFSVGLGRQSENLILVEHLSTDSTTVLLPVLVFPMRKGTRHSFDGPLRMIPRRATANRVYEKLVLCALKKLTAASA